MPVIFGDTSGLLAAFVATEQEHPEAAKLMRQWSADGTCLVTTDLLLDAQADRKLGLAEKLSDLLLRRESGCLLHLYLHPVSAIIRYFEG